MELAQAFARSLFAWCSKRSVTWRRAPREGDICQARLAEDGQWHDAVIKSAAPDPALFQVMFLEYGNLQVVNRDNLLLIDIISDSDGEHGMGTCEMCGLNVPLTRHHLRPRKTHAKLKKQGFSQDELMMSAYICRWSEFNHPRPH